MSEFEDHRVVLPEESIQLVRFRQDEAPGSALINVGLRGFEPRVVFGWHLSMMIVLDEVDSDQLPTKAERDVINGFGRALEVELVGNDVNKPLAVFLGQIHWNGTSELIWRVFDPERANRFLESILNAEDDRRPRPFDFRIDHDPEWRLCHWHLEERST